MYISRKFVFLLHSVDGIYPTSISRRMPDDGMPRTHFTVLGRLFITTDTKINASLIFQELSMNQIVFLTKQRLASVTSTLYKVTLDMSVMIRKYQQ